MPPIIISGAADRLKIVHARHIEEHNEIVTAAPTAEDQMAYLVAYAAAIGDVA